MKSIGGAIHPRFGYNILRQNDEGRWFVRQINYQVFTEFVEFDHLL